MPTVSYKVGAPYTFSDLERDVFLSLIKMQGRVINPTIARVNSCSLLGVCQFEKKIVSIGAIKPATKSDFGIKKADVKILEEIIKDELGYCFTIPEYTGKGFSSSLVSRLIQEFGEKDLIASTEMRNSNSMVRILERSGFKQTGRFWKSGKDGSILGLFVKLI